MKRFFTNPIIVVSVILLALVAMIFAPGVEFGPFLAGGALMKALTAFVAGFVLMTLVLLARMMRVLFNEGEASDIESNPMAKAVLYGFIYLAFGIVVASVFG